MSARDVVETLAILLAAGLGSQLLAAFLRVPRMVVLVGVGALLGPDVAGALDLPLDSVAVQILLTLGVSMILFHGGLGLSGRPGARDLPAAPGDLAGVAGHRSPPRRDGRLLTIDVAGGSGFLGAFVAGLIVGNMDELGLGMHSQRESEMRSFAATSADVVVMFVFLVLGANLPFDELADEALPALLTVAALVLVACLGADRRGHWERRELVFVAWTRETGVVPAALAALLVAEGVPYEVELVTVVVVAIVVTLAVQSTTKAWLARRLGLDAYDQG